MIHSYYIFQTSEELELCVCCVCVCLPAGAGKRYHTHDIAPTYCPTLRGQYLQFILFCKITQSQCLTISASLPTACHFHCMFQWMSVIQGNYGLFWACRASCGSNTLLPTRANPPLSPYVYPPLHLSIPRASTTCSNSFSAQLLHPVGMWVNVNLMVCRSLCI